MKTTAQVTSERPSQRGWATASIMALAGAGFMLLATLVNFAGGGPTSDGLRAPVAPQPLPLFQFAFFYQGDMEFCPGTAMTIGGPVHGNANIYLQPQAELTFFNNVSAAGSVVLDKSPKDPSARSVSTVTFDGFHLNEAATLSLPGRAKQGGAGAGAILALAAPGQSPRSAAGRNLLYNQADLIILVSNDNSIKVTSGVAIDNQATTIDPNQWQSFLSTNGSFYDQRDNLTVNPVVLNVSNLVSWSATNSILRPVLARVRGNDKADVQSIYIADLRDTRRSVVTTNLTCVTNWLVDSQPGIVLSNGAVLPPQGLSIATPDPAYIAGNWNIRTNFGGASDAGSPDTSCTRPSAIYADAINILSPAWNPAKSALPLSERPAASDTVNAAFFSGNVPSNGSDYSGGVENFPRFLEDWSGHVFTYNGSMACMFASQIANQPWQPAGAVYNPPIRRWAFDRNFNSPSRQPPLTPQLVSDTHDNLVSLRSSARSF